MGAKKVSLRTIQASRSRRRRLAASRSADSLVSPLSELTTTEAAAKITQFSTRAKDRSLKNLKR